MSQPGKGSKIAWSAISNRQTGNARKQRTTLSSKLLGWLIRFCGMECVEKVAGAVFRH